MVGCSLLGATDRLEQAVFVGTGLVRIYLGLLMQKLVETAANPIFAVRRNKLFLRHGILLFKR